MAEEKIKDRVKVIVLVGSVSAVSGIILRQYLHTNGMFLVEALAIVSCIFVWKEDKQRGITFWKALAIVNLILGIYTIMVPGHIYWFFREFFDSIAYLLRR